MGIITIVSQLSHRMLSDTPLEVFSPWQVTDYEPPTAAGGVVPRNAYGNVELFKLCMLPKGTAHLSNRMISDIPLEVFGPWQVSDYEPPTAVGGVVPRNAYGNVELFKLCMLPKGTAHVRLPGLNKVAKKLNIDCAPAMTGFDYNGGYSHPVYDGYVVCKEFEEIITEAWLMDQEDQERRENEKMEARVYGNWKKLIKGLLIRERLKHKYGFEEPSTSTEVKKKAKGPKLVVKKRN